MCARGDLAISLVTIPHVTGRFPSRVDVMKYRAPRMRMMTRVIPSTLIQLRPLAAGHE